MYGCTFEPVVIDPVAGLDASMAFRRLADAAASYLERLETHIATADPAYRAFVSRIRGTGPGVSFRNVLGSLERHPLKWECPFEGSGNVSGAALRARDVLGEDRDDGFLFLRFTAGTQDLPLHIHPSSDRFIYVIGGRGFFHVSAQSLESCTTTDIRHIPARDRDAFMFRRGVVHTFSTADHPLHLLSYHRPFIELDDDTQYTVGAKPLRPSEFLQGVRGQVSFDAGWTCLA